MNITINQSSSNFSPTQLPGFQPGLQEGYETGLKLATETIQDFIYILATISLIYLILRFTLNRLEFSKEVHIASYSYVLTPEKLYYSMTDIFYTLVLGITGFLLSVQLIY